MSNAIASVILCFMVVMTGGWLNHIVTCLTEDRWGFLIAGAICFPIGVIHGIGLFFGVW